MNYDPNHVGVVYPRLLFVVCILNLLRLFRVFAIILLTMSSLSSVTCRSSLFSDSSLVSNGSSVSESLHHFSDGSVHSSVSSHVSIWCCIFVRHANSN